MSGIPIHVFISHASQDRQIAETLCATLEDRGLKCWLARREVAPGENFQAAIVRAIRGSRIMLLAFTTNTNGSDGIKKELALASQNKLVVIPLPMENIKPDDAFAFELVTRQWVDMFEDWERGVEQLVTCIAALHPQDSDQLNRGAGNVNPEFLSNVPTTRTIAELPTEIATKPAEKEKRQILSPGSAVSAGLPDSKRQREKSIKPPAAARSSGTK